MKTMKRTDFVDYLINIRDRGTRPIGMLVDTETQGVRKLQKVAGLIGFNYEHSVQKATEDPAFKAGPRSWGQHITPSVIAHKGNLYLQVKIQGRRPAVYYDAASGKLVAPPVSNRKPDTAAVKVRTYKVSNIRRVHIDGRKFDLVG